MERQGTAVHISMFKYPCPFLEFFTSIGFYILNDSVLFQTDRITEGTFLSPNELTC